MAGFQPLFSLPHLFRGRKTALGISGPSYLVLRLSGLVLAGLLSLATVSTCLAADKTAASLDARLKALPSDALKDLFSFVAGNTLFTLFHEGGHMLVSELGLPVAGQQEEVVDTLTTMTMLATDSEDMNLYLSNAMIGWFLIADRNFDDLAFYRQHDLNSQRGSKMLCLLVGSDKEAFLDLALDLGLSKAQAETCSSAYEQAFRSWQQETNGYLRDDDTPAGMTAVDYGQAAPDLQAIEIFLRESGLMELAAEEFDRLYALPAPVSFSAKACSEKSAYWDPALHEVTVCYELMAGFAEIYLDLLTSN